ncbi:MULTISPECIES: ATPase domain-containing protein [unclassified Duganella]|uniref:ATPase domain-containing protein n=1 Tax=unclassified Duganella TaxID=2636909 RepID=UPI000701AB28|nr:MULTISPECIES: ATPase domain-containing protein [unclassified Duganella]KQV58072.1 circadian clock protein KaiC [Duganella sp. Root336D2]KRB99079.1 circadian clock protein KaiC [Duganella sp. Root198D2]
MLQPQNKQTDAFISTGIAGLDTILAGGLTKHRLYLVEGEPGTGKTTMALQFLMEGARHGEPVLYITLAENEVELRAVAQSHGFTLDGITVHEIIPAEGVLDPDEQYTVFHPSEVELGETNRLILAQINRLNPTRMVLDSLSELQLLAGSPLRYRRHVLALKQYFAKRACTALFLDDKTALGGDQQVRSIAHGVISLQQLESGYGAERRVVRVLKYRGIDYRRGPHDYVIISGGVVAYPRIVASESREIASRGQVASGLPLLDTLLGGGIEEGSSTLVSGPPGTGKSSLAAQFVKAVTDRGQKAAMFVFEESYNTLLNRADGIGMDLRTPLASGLLQVNQVDPAELSPGQFTHAVCTAADEGAKVIVIDSLNGYMNAMPEARFLTTHLREVLTYLGQRGVVTLLVGVQQSMIGTMGSKVDVSYLADNVLLLRYYESGGSVHKALSVFKKRGSKHETTLRAFSISDQGIEVGPVLKDFRGILTGVPVNVSQDKDEAEHE